MSVVVSAARLAVAVGMLSLSACGGGGGGGGGGSPPPSNNQIPVANAGADQTTFRRTQVSLDATGSTDPENSALRYTWVQTAGPAVQLSDAAAAQPTFMTPSTNATLTFSLTVSDGSNTSVADTVTVTVGNRMPQANGGEDRTARLRAEVTLDASASFDPDGDTLAYAWVQESGPAVEVSVTANGSLRFMTGASPAVYTFRLTVSDGEFTSAADIVSVASSHDGVNRPPFAELQYQPVAPRNQYVTIYPWIYDPDNQPVTFTWTQVRGPTVTLENTGYGSIGFFTPNEETEYEFTLTATDGVLSTTASAIVQVRNFAPAVYGLYMNPVQPRSIDSITATANFFDPDGDAVAITYEWFRNGARINGQTSHILSSGLFARGDEIRLSVTVSDGSLSQTIDSVTTIADTPPVLTASPPESVNHGELFTFQVTASDPDGDEYAFALAYGPSGMEIDADGTVTWTPTLPMFDRTLDVHWGLTTVGHTEPALEGTVRVDDADRDYPLRRTLLQHPTSDQAFVVADFDRDGTDSLLIGSNDTVYELAASGPGYSQTWVYPFQTGGTPVLALAAADLSGSSALEIIVASATQTFVLDGVNRRSLGNYPLPANRSCRDIKVGNLDGIGNLELVCLSQEYGYHSPRIIVFDATQRTVLWQSPVLRSAGQVAIGNVDGDAALEIVTSDGYVFDGITYANEWASPQAFGARVRIADVNNDGRGDIIGATPYVTESGVTVIDGSTRNVIWQISGSAEGIEPVDLDDDGAFELIVADSFGVKRVYRRAVSGASEVVMSLPTEMNPWYSNIIRVGNFDNDSVPDIAIATNLSYSNGDIILAELNETPTMLWDSPPTQPTAGSFFGGQLATISPGVQRLIFGAATSYPAGELWAIDAGTASIQRRSLYAQGYGSIGIDVVDYDNDGVDEIFMAGLSSSSQWNGGFEVYDFQAGAHEWQSGALTQNAYANTVFHGLIDSDGQLDLIGGDSYGYVSMFSPAGSRLLWRSDQSVASYNLAVGDVDGDGVPELVTGGNGQISLYRRVSVSGEFELAEQASVDSWYYVSAFAIGDIEGDSDVEILAMSNSMRRVYVFDAELNLLREFSVAYDAQTMFIEHTSADRKNILLGVTAYSPDNFAGIIAVDSVDGSEVWRSPSIGMPLLNSLRYVDVTGGPEREIVIGTNRGLLVTR